MAPALSELHAHAPGASSASDSPMNLQITTSHSPSDEGLELGASDASQATSETSVAETRDASEEGLELDATEASDSLATCCDVASDSSSESCPELVDGDASGASDVDDDASGASDPESSSRPSAHRRKRARRTLDGCQDKFLGHYFTSRDWCESEAKLFKKMLRKRAEIA